MNPESTSLLTEHLRWTPLSLIDDIINTINTILYQSVAAVEDFLLSAPPSALGFHPPPGQIPDTDSEGRILLAAKEAEELNTGIHQLETLLENGIDKSFDRFELYVLRNILIVQPDLVGWVRLAHHKNIDFSTIPPPADPPPPATTTNPPAHEAQARLRKLRQTLLAAHALNATLAAEATKNNRTISQLRTLISASSSTTTETGVTINNPFSFLNSTGGTGGQSGGAKEVRDSIAFAVSQADLIRSLIGTLRLKFKALLEERRRKAEEEEKVAKVEDGEDTVMGDAPDMASGDKMLTAEEERKRYIERMTRRHMEASRGLRLNAKGEVVGGDFEGAAKKGLQDVEALEGVVGSLVEKKEGGGREGGARGET